MRRLAGALGVVLLAAACSGGSGGSSGGVDTKNDQPKADAAVLQQDDLPGGDFSSSSSSSRSSNEAESAASSQFDNCVHSAIGADPKEFDKDRTAKAKQSFSRGSGAHETSVEGEVEMYGDRALVSKQLAAVSQPASGDCIKQAFVDEFTALGATVGDVGISATKVDGVGDEGAGFVLNVPVTINGVNLALGVEFDFTRVGRVGLTAVVLSLGSPADHSLAVTAMTAMAGRVQQ